MSETLSFFTDLFDVDVPNGLLMQLWQKDGRRSSYFRSAPDATAFADQHRKDLYVGVSLCARNYGPTKRAPANESAGIPGLWADIDVNGGPEGKTGAAPDLAAAYELINAVLEPTIIVHSGYGLQGWWLFEDGPWTFHTHQEREKAATIAAGWIALLREAAEDRGFGIDATQDLARLMRVPGSINGKGGLTAPCKGYPDAVHQQDGPRYDLEVLAELAATAKAPATAVRDTLDGLVGEFEVRPEADPPFTKMTAALENSPTFAKTYNHARRDKTSEAWSTSEYDMSLASQAVALGWTDQEIVDLIVAHRRKFGELEKALRPDYMRRTLARARRDSRTIEREREVETHLDNLEAIAAQGSADPDAVMTEFNGVINSQNFKVRDLFQYGEDPKAARYHMVLDNGKEVNIGPPGVLFNPDAFREAFGVVTGHVVMPVKRDRWLAALQALLHVRHVKVEDDDTAEGQVKDWLQRYIGERLITDQQEAAQRREPFEKDGKLHVYAASLTTFVNRNMGRRISEADLKAMLRSAGFSTTTVSYRNDKDKATSRSYYAAPKEVVE